MLNISLAALGQFITDQALALTVTSAISSVGGLLVGRALAARPDLKDEAQVFADHTEAAEAIVRRTAVVAAEVFGVKADKFGFDKLTFAADTIEATLASAGIKGDPARADWKTLFASIKASVAQLFPVKTKRDLGIEPPTPNF